VHRKADEGGIAGFYHDRENAASASSSTVVVAVSLDNGERGQGGVESAGEVSLSAR
jgi:hypothetical protein